MATNEQKTSLVRDALFPSKEHYDSIIKRIQTSIKESPAVAAEFKKDPSKVLGAYGLNEDVQHEALRSMKISADWCIITCITSCWFTHLLD